MARIAETRDGWINFQPAVDPDDAPPPPSVLGQLVTARGPAVPVATWTPGEQKRRRVEPPSVGIQHASGPKAVARLAELGHPVPQGWVTLDDSPKRGLVLAVPPAEEHETVLRWLLGAAMLLTDVPLQGPWRALIY